MRFMISLVLALATIGSAIAASPPRVTGVESSLVFSASNSQAVKKAKAECPPGKQVVGGGGVISGDAAHVPSPWLSVMLTQLEPYTRLDPQYGLVYGYAARASETYSGTTGNWWVSASVVCADPVPGFHIVYSQSEASSSAVQTAIARCPSGQSALGTGARINHYLPQPQGLGLQVARASGIGDIGRAQAHEVPQGYPYEWQLMAFAICANTPAGYHTLYGDSVEHESQEFKNATAVCPAQMLGAGAAVDNTAPGNVTLNAVGPLSSAYAAAVENTYTSASWGGVVAQAICVD
jgi:hypothetical protein